ncbi:MAG: hypothetical protein CEN91_570, partial [Candidatus Berkelbacteria bacterium Licking1014_85]
MIGAFAQKIGMSQIFDEKGRRIPVTLVKIGKNYITDIFAVNSKKKITVTGFEVKKIHKSQKKVLESMQIEDNIKKSQSLYSDSEYTKGQKITSEIFAQGDMLI